MYFMLRSQQNFQTHLKLSFLFTAMSNISSKSFQDDWNQEWRTILQLLPDFTSLSNNTYVFRELQANNTTHFSRVYIKQYCTKQYWLIQSSYQTFTLPQSYYQTILSALLKIWMDTWTDWKFSNRKFPSKSKS